jgi:hypothetical protein
MEQMGFYMTFSFKESYKKYKIVRMWQAILKGENEQTLNVHLVQTRGVKTTHGKVDISWLLWG